MVIRTTNRSGLSLIEVVVSISLISILALTTINASTGLSRRRMKESRHSDAAKVMGQFMDEVAAFPFEDSENPIFGPESDETDRAAFDDVDDFHGFTMTSPTDRAGNAMAEVDQWQLMIEVISVAVDASGTLTPATAESRLRQIRVTLTDDLGQVHEANRLVAKTIYEPSTEVRSWIGRVNVNSDGVVRQDIVPLMNQPLRSNGL